MPATRPPSVGAYASVVDFDVFRGPLIVALRRSDRNRGGRPPFDPVMMFKILVLQALYSLSDEGCEFQSIHPAGAALRG